MRTTNDEKRSLESLALETLDDTNALSVYADWLTDRGDPRGDFIRTQLALERPDLDPEQQQALAQIEETLREAHAEAWLGALAPAWLGEWEGVYPTKWIFRRGYLFSLELDSPEDRFVEGLLASEETRHIRRLFLDRCDDEVLPALACVAFPQVRVFHYGDGTGTIQEEGYAAALVANMPRIEELSVSGRRVQTAELFALTMPALRTLDVSCSHRYATAVLANNRSLGMLQSISFFPHANEYGDNGYLGSQHIEDIAHSPHLTALKRLSLQLCTAGDRGCEIIAASGLLGRLVDLDLSLGEITDEGARILASAPEIAHLERLDVSNNRLTQAGIDSLVRAGIAHLSVSGQRATDSRDYLYEGNIE